MSGTTCLEALLSLPPIALSAKLVRMFIPAAFWK